jgi:hypothetical protein
MGAGGADEARRGARPVHTTPAGTMGTIAVGHEDSTLVELY